ncbi:26S protease regulatory subunit 6A [Artemisia annua]|uniref:26S protease regulatory subunit 6A n=1 Tax=Artemisia annua TaxID=35608 RepID=A0A2U1L039_ARTAN|nr:26S protease regulatory subunit 6A [Artemisia annua]
MRMFIVDGAKLIRDAFELAKEISPCIIFIDEIDDIGTKRFHRKQCIKEEETKLTTKTTEETIQKENKFDTVEHA